MNYINLVENIKAFEHKLTTYIDVYNITYTDNNNTNTDEKNINDKFYLYDEVYEVDEVDEITDNTIIHYTTIKLERIGNIERLYQNFNNNTKCLNKELRYSIHKTNILVILDTLHYIMNTKDRYFDFTLYSYELYNVIGVDNIHIIQKKNKNLNYNFTGSCIMLIFIRDKMFIHYY